MRSCPTCGRDSLRVMEGTKHFNCEACNTVIFHEGNGYVVEIF